MKNENAYIFFFLNNKQVTHWTRELVLDEHCLPDPDGGLISEDEYEMALQIAELRNRILKMHEREVERSRQLQVERMTLG